MNHYIIRISRKEEDQFDKKNDVIFKIFQINIKSDLLLLMTKETKYMSYQHIRFSWTIMKRTPILLDVMDNVTDIICTSKLHKRS
jgi:hypothetical protein